MVIVSNPICRGCGLESETGRHFACACACPALFSLNKCFNVKHLMYNKENDFQFLLPRLTTCSILKKRSVQIMCKFIESKIMKHIRNFVYIFLVTSREDRQNTNKTSF